MLYLQGGQRIEAMNRLLGLAIATNAATATGRLQLPHLPVERGPTASWY
ncbi:hypothetical protein DFAR_330039 [Desulfarculales bacterium]